jgi:hypothetical protein
MKNKIPENQCCGFGYGIQCCFDPGSGKNTVCCGCRSGIWCLFDPWIRNPGNNIPNPQHCSLKPEHSVSIPDSPPLALAGNIFNMTMTGLLTFRRFQRGGLRGGGGGLTARRRLHLDRLVLLARRVLQG